MWGDHGDQNREKHPKIYHGVKQKKTTHEKHKNVKIQSDFDL